MSPWSRRRLKAQRRFLEDLSAYLEPLQLEGWQKSYVQEIATASDAQIQEWIRLGAARRREQEKAAYRATVAAADRAMQVASAMGLLGPRPSRPSDHRLDLGVEP